MNRKAARPNEQRRKRDVNAERRGKRCCQPFWFLIEQKLHLDGMITVDVH
jgi:hypothetical protein